MKNGPRRQQVVGLAAGRPGPRLLGQLELGLLHQDRPLEPLQRGARVDPQLLDERAPCLLVALERIGLPAGAVEGQHELGQEALAHRVLGHQRLELADHVVVPAEREVRLDAVGEGGEPKLLEPGDRRLGKGLVGEVGERRPTP